VTHQRCLIKLNDLDEPRVNLLKAVLVVVLLDTLFNIFVDLLLDIRLFWENILKKRLEEWDVLSDELRQVHISQGTAHDHFLVSAWDLSSLGVTSSSEYRKNVSETEIVVTLF
jgi:hypothetical protein